MHEQHLRNAIALAQRNVEHEGGRPFGAVLVRNGELLATGVNRVLSTHDPTSHAEIEALRAASASLRQSDLHGAIMYASAHPCPMCLAAMHFARVERAYYAYDLRDAEPYGFSTALLYAALQKPLDDQSLLPLTHMPVRVAELDPYAAWQARH